MMPLAPCSDSQPTQVSCSTQSLSISPAVAAGTAQLAYGVEVPTQSRVSDCRTPFSPSPVLQVLAPLTVVGRLLSSGSTTLRLTGHVSWVCSAHSLCTAGFPRAGLVKACTPHALGHKPLLCGCPANAGVLAAPLLLCRWHSPSCPPLCDNPKCLHTVPDVPWGGRGVKIVSGGEPLP